MKDVKKLIRESRLPEETVPICLRGDLVAQFERLERELERAQQKPSDSLAGSGARAIAERMEAVREQMAAATVEFVLRAMPDDQWYDFRDGHPPRDGEDKDQGLGVNVDTFFPALLRRSVVSPELDDEDWAALKLTAKQRRDLNTAAWNVNQGDVDIPFSAAASMILNSEPGSRRPNDSASPSPGSAGGSTPPDMSTTTTGG